MKTNVLTHIVPTLPPQTGGAGDYAFNLACQLRDHYGMSSQFILCDPDWDGPARIGDFVIRRLRLPNEAGLWSLLATIKSENSPPVLLHYDGYAYHKHGAPAWLYRGIKSWLEEGNRGSANSPRKFATIFHELWETSTRLWERSFYMQGFQRRLVEKLHRGSQYSITSSERYMAQLDFIEPQKTWLLPTPGSLPVTDLPMLKARHNAPMRVVIWGESRSRFNSISVHSNLLRTLDKERRLASVVLTGKSQPPSRAANLDVELLQKYVSSERIDLQGELSPGELTLSLSLSDLCLFAFGGNSACKSGLFMAALAAGCVPVLRDGLDAAPLQERKHFVASDDTPSSVRRFQQIASSGEIERIAIAGRSWYQRYADGTVIAKKYQELLQGRLPLETPREIRLNPPVWNRRPRLAD